MGAWKRLRGFGAEDRGCVETASLCGSGMEIHPVYCHHLDSTLFFFLGLNT